MLVVDQILDSSFLLEISNSWLDIRGIIYMVASVLAYLKQFTANSCTIKEMLALQTQLLPQVGVIYLGMYTLCH